MVELVNVSVMPGLCTENNDETEMTKLRMFCVVVF